MNAQGISVFYGATCPDIVLAEVRPPVGSFVALACFEIIRLLRLLDLTAFGDVHQFGSIFDSDYTALLERLGFLKTLCQRMIDPVMPDDEETDYLPIQAIADYLAFESQVALDGILYPSVQVDMNGLNLVLFHKSARRAELDIPEGTEIDGMIYYSTEDGDELDPTVLETPPPAKEEGTEKDSAGPFKQGSIPRDGRGQFNHDSRKITLRIDPESVRVHQVQALAIKTDEARVNRHRSETDDSQALF